MPPLRRPGFHPRDQFVVGNEPVGPLGDAFAVDEDDEFRDATHVEPIDERWIVARIHRGHDGIGRPGDVGQHGFHARADPAAVGVELQQDEVVAVEEGVECVLVGERNGAIEVGCGHGFR